MFGNQTLLRSLSLLVTLGLMACGDSPTEPGEGGGTGSDASIRDYLTGLSYDGSSLLNVQPIASGDVAREETGSNSSTEFVPGVGTKVCKQVSYDLKQNFGSVAILRPTAGVVWPGALIKANQAMMAGVPEPVRLGRSAVTLSIDLPGMGQNGIVVVNDPTNSSVQAAIDDALGWWNNNAYEEGYVNAANSSYSYTSSFSSEQTALDLGLNMAWASGDFSGKFSSFTSTTKTVVTAAYKQAFYTVNFDSPRSPEEVFNTSVSLSQVKSEMDSQTPPAYVGSVTYGRILVFRMENTNSVSTTDLEAAFNYGVGRISASGSLALRYKSILSTSKIEVITIGGNAEVASQAVTGNLIDVIQGSNATYSRSNPGVPIAYQMKFLRDDSLAKLGYTTEYTTTECFDAGLKITLDFGNIVVTGDCDGIGAGEVTWALELLDQNGVKFDGVNGYTVISSGNKISPANKHFVFNVSGRDLTKFSVRMRISETDQDILGKTFHDDRMDNRSGTKVHTWSDGKWSSTGGPIWIGDTNSCKFGIGYNFSSNIIND
jgi:thiol-activated cytolysin